MRLCKIISFSLILSLASIPAWAMESTKNKFEVLKIGQKLPNATLMQDGKPAVQLDQLKGRVKIISIVPKLNTPTCDEQTHKFSEENGGLDQKIDIVTISTNPADVQTAFANKAKIHNILFLSDAPNYEFGENTGLLRSDMKFLMRTVMVVDENNVIRYVDFVPGGGLPQIGEALKAAERVIAGRAG
ncbi:MAG: redoxin family protein [Nitrospina sp.]|nr:redoxin family protein [Nitrospina sp.]